MEVHTQKFILLTTLFHECPSLAELFHEDDHPNITWGGATRTMVQPSEILSWAERTLEDDWWIEEYDPKTLHREVEILQSRIWALTDVLVDLEN